MKHILSVTAVLVLMFFLSQVIGLGVLYGSIDQELYHSTGEVFFDDIEILGVVFERPDIQGVSKLFWQQFTEQEEYQDTEVLGVPLKSEQVESSVQGATATLGIISAVIIGTLLIFLIIKFNKPIPWKVWFLFAVIMCLAFAFKTGMPDWGAVVLAVLLGYVKVFRPNVFVHNLTELFIYSGLAVIFVPVLNVIAMFGLLAVISLYDMYAVWRSKHMVKLAEFQAQTNVFAGLFIPYSAKQKKIMLSKPVKVKKGAKTKLSNALLGGGDMGFPLFFTGVMFQAYGLVPALIIIPFTTAALALLFFLAKKDRFYPAMPFLSAGCLAGFVVMQLVI